MKIHLPNSAFLGNIDPFLKGFESAEPEKLVITANDKWISVHPVVLSMIAALGLNLNPSNVHCETPKAKSRHYFERMGLFRILGINSGIEINEHESAGRFIPLTQIRNSSELTKFMTEMIPLLHLETHQAEPIKYVVSELVRNVFEHALSTTGAVLCAQYYSKTNTIRIGIADTGVGIKKSITQSHRAKTDLEAIQLALTPGITGTTSREGGTEFNAGAGLFFIKSIAKVNRNFFMIYSGNAMYKLLKSKVVRLSADPFRDKNSRGEDYPYWQGTAVGLDISLSVTQDFSNLLDLIRTTYTQSVQERKKIKYTKPRFI